MTIAATLSAPTSLSILEIASASASAPRSPGRPAAERVGQRHRGRPRRRTGRTRACTACSSRSSPSSGWCGRGRRARRRRPRRGRCTTRAILTAFSTASAPELNSARLLGVVAGGEPVERLAHLDVALVRRDHEAGVGERGDLLLDVARRPRSAALPTLTTAMPEPRSISELPSTSTRTPPPARLDEDRQRGADAAGDTRRCAGRQLGRARARGSR